MGIVLPTSHQAFKLMPHPQSSTSGRPMLSGQPLIFQSSQLPLQTDLNSSDNRATNGEVLNHRDLF